MKNIINCICVLCLVGCKTVEIPTQQDYIPYKEPILQRYVSYDRTELKLPVSDYVVKKIIREKKLYIIDLECSDSIFRVFSPFDDKKRAGDVKLHKHDTVRVELIEPSEFERETLWDNPFIYGEVDFEYYGVYISKYLRDMSYDKVRFCDEFNGRYLRSKKK